MIDFMKINELARSALATRNAMRAAGDNVLNVTISMASDDTCPKIHIYEGEGILKELPGCERKPFMDDDEQLVSHYGGCEFFCIVPKEKPLP